ncbi:hypothetical protein PP175_21705 [Aneurinibacillus sp. Ricciae_BoGa-3]|uniref:hypothetical protein n=1 Tax=Aneurinibacillus sp. Ricciae_BoGa-3 TaxID=3022697 RepID=UPI00234129B7|nr:hypothetical protein [Aneurinibacillus sp. Ricciae_BoGa-3]WCK53907.1 hypothetical protein PP175_21705 [Aneurinibacillus sp. Ricciae_BoGa-3]
MSDIEHVRVVGVSGQEVLHWEHCQFEHDLPELIAQVLPALKSRTYTLAVYPYETSEQFLRKQPVIISLDPEISYRKYPDHPHLNVPFTDTKTGFHMPASFCYTDNPDLLGDDNYSRVKSSLQQATLWLLRHEVWLETRKRVAKGVWIGPNAELLPSWAYPGIIDTEGKCHCGSGNLYKLCHYERDLKEREELLFKDSPEQMHSIKYLKDDPHLFWCKVTNIPSRKSLDWLRS